mgnify:CR=1 FL=1
MSDSKHVLIFHKEKIKGLITIKIIIQLRVSTAFSNLKIESFEFELSESFSKCIESILIIHIDLYNLSNIKTDLDVFFTIFYSMAHSCVKSIHILEEQ